MSAASRLQQTESARRAALKAELESLIERKAQASTDLRKQRAAMLAGDAKATREATETSTLVAALEARAAEVERSIKVLDANGSESDRKKFASELEKMTTAFVALRTKNAERCRKLGAALAKQIVALRQELHEMEAEERTAFDDARSLACLLDPTATANSLSHSGLSFGGLSGLRIETRKAHVAAAQKAGVSQTEIRNVLDLD